MLLHNTMATSTHISIARDAALPRYQQLKDMLVSQIQSREPGDRMPSIRQLIDQSGLAHQTVVKAMAELQQEGYIDLVQGRGAFVARRARPVHGAPAGPNGTVVLATPEWDDRQIFCVNHEAGVQAVRAGCRLMPWRFFPGTTLEQLAAFARVQERLVGIVVMQPAQDIPPADAAHCSALGIPVVFLQPGSPTGERLHTVCGDPTATGALLAGRLVAAGHRRLAFAQVQPRSVITDAMVAGACRVAAEAGLPPLQVIETGTTSWSDPLDAVPAACARLGDASGLICTSGIAAFAAVRALRRLGRQVPQEVSVIGSADSPLLAHADPAITTTTVDFAEQLAAAFALIAAGPGRQSGTVTVPVRVVERESVVPPIR